MTTPQEPGTAPDDHLRPPGGEKYDDPRYEEFGLTADHVSRMWARYVDQTHAPSGPMANLIIGVTSDVARALLAAKQPEPPSEPDMRAVCEALGFDPTNHHNAAKCPYCRPAGPTSEPVVLPELMELVQKFGQAVSACEGSVEAYKALESRLRAALAAIPLPSPDAEQWKRFAAHCQRVVAAIKAKIPVEMAVEFMGEEIDRKIAALASQDTSDLDPDLLAFVRATFNEPAPLSSLVQPAAPDLMRAAGYALHALCEESAAYPDELFHVEAAISHLVACGVKPIVVLEKAAAAPLEGTGEERKKGTP